MLRRAALLVGLLFVSACAVGERPTLEGAGQVADAAAASNGDTQGRSATPDGAGSGGDGVAAAGPTATEDETGSPLPDREVLGNAPPVLISPTGVLVPVLARNPVGYEVLTPCGNEVDLTYGQPVWDATVVLDPGHGGDEKGALSPDGATEAEVNLDVARRTGALLEAQGVAVALTRSADYRIPVRNRAAIADQLQAKAFVSIHHNSPSAQPADEPGSEVYVQSGNAQSRRLGGLIYEAVTQALSEFDVAWTGRPDAGVLTVLNSEGKNAYGITRYPAAPVALAELSYIANPSEAVLIGTDEYRQAAAEALAAAIIRFLSTDEPGRGFVENPRLFNPSGDTGGTTGCVDPPLS
ncbi:MAG: N-acetylmuramoyl-L-alanine amidase [Acidimicrobiia bacterium]|nr:N-acetylmuramoyl-L-alanine amidase [Acidimicrobiia bacterium]